MFDFTQHTTSLICRQGKGSLFRSLKSFPQEACRPALSIILIIFFCKQKFLYYKNHQPTGSNHENSKVHGP